MPLRFLRDIQSHTALPRCKQIAAAVFGILALQHDVALAQVTKDAGNAVPASPTFVIQGFDIVGENPLADGETTAVLAPFLRTDATMETLQKATAALEARLKDKGFALHKLVVPPQTVGGAIQLNVVKFVIGKVVLEGQSLYSEANIRASLPELREGASPNLKTLAIQTAMANESQGKQLQVALKESEEPNSIDVRIAVKEMQPWNVSLSASNTGSSATGGDRITLAGGHSNVWDRDQGLTLALTTSLERPNDVRQIGLNYRVPLYSLGGVTSMSYTQSDVSGDFGAFRSNGAGKTMGLNYIHYLAPVGGYRGYVSLGVEDKQFDATQINGMPLVGQLPRRSRPFTLGYNAKMENDSSVWTYNTDFVANLTGGDGNDVVSYQSEDTRIATNRWMVLRGGGSYTTSMWDNWLWGVRGQFQYSNEALIAGEQFGIGGASSVRGTGERPLAGDSGAQVSMEVNMPMWLPGLRILGFFDNAWLASRNVSGGAKLPNDGLSSVGLGLRYAVSNITVSADFGRLMRGSSMPYVAGSGLPQAGDQKLHVNLSARF